jgi:hypothetical protein
MRSRWADRGTLPACSNACRDPATEPVYQNREAGMTHDDDVQREIEANQRRARDEQDVGLEEDVLNDQDGGDGTILDDLGEAIFGNDEDDSRKREVEYDDRDGGTNKFIPE